MNGGVNVDAGKIQRLLRKKIDALGNRWDSIEKRIADLKAYEDYHSGAIDKVVGDQVDVPVAEQIRAGGGGKFILKEVIKLLEENFAPS